MEGLIRNTSKSRQVYMRTRFCHAFTFLIGHLKLESIVDLLKKKDCANMQADFHHGTFIWGLQ